MNSTSIPTWANGVSLERMIGGVSWQSGTLPFPQPKLQTRSMKAELDKQIHGYRLKPKIQSAEGPESFIFIIRTTCFSRRISQGNIPCFSAGELAKPIGFYRYADQKSRKSCVWKPGSVLTSPPRYSSRWKARESLNKICQRLSYFSATSYYYYFLCILLLI